MIHAFTSGNEVTALPNPAVTYRSTPNSVDMDMARSETSEGTRSAATNAIRTRSDPSCGPGRPYSYSMTTLSGSDVVEDGQSASVRYTAPTVESIRRFDVFTVEPLA